VWGPFKLLIKMITVFNKYKIKILLFIAIVIIASMVLIVRLNYPFGVKQYKTISLGMRAMESAGTHTIWAPPDDKVPESDFYVYSIGDESMCIGPSCGIGAYFVDCLGGWTSGYDYSSGEVDDYGLREAGVDIENLKIITIADKEGKVVGIYPGAKIINLPYIMMRNHQDLVDKDRFKVCSDLLPSRWK